MTSAQRLRPSRPPLTPARRRILRQRAVLLLRLVWGLAVAGALAYSLWQPGNWPQKLGLWVLLTLLADEAGGWFGYLGVVLGGLPFVASHAPPEQWFVIVPLVGGSLIAALIVKHSGGPLVLPFSYALFALPMLLAQRFGPSIDATLTLPANASFRRSTLLMAALGLGFSFLRQVAGIVLRRRLERPRLADPRAAPDQG
ncbi:hypothetical protein [Deinococcus sp.]|uniref:hypothetical protein n=1 Tax=Deinococcus sp. TaxID=47478 RepID=UPI003CC5DC34